MKICSASELSRDGDSELSSGNGKKRRVLVIKTGQTEMLAEDTNTSISLGDVYSASCLLWKFLNDEVTWLTSKAAKPLVAGRPFVQRCLVLSEGVLVELLNESFDIVINLERTEETKLWVKEYQALRSCEVIQWQLGLAAPLGCDVLFKQDTKPSGKGLNGTNGCSGSKHDSEMKFAQIKKRSYQHYLYSSIGSEWDGQPCLPPANIDLDISPVIEIGFNYAVGSKWPTKAWPKEYWQELAGLCHNEGISVSFQAGFNDLQKYMSWIQKCRLLVSSDSLGLHLALGLNRYAIGLFGPTASENIHMFEQGETLVAGTSCPKAPCYQNECDFARFCMNEISPEFVLSRIKEYLTRPLVPSQIPYNHGFERYLKSQVGVPTVAPMLTEA